jgi:hypothetical protein
LSAAQDGQEVRLLEPHKPITRDLPSRQSHS